MHATGQFSDFSDIAGYTCNHVSPKVNEALRPLVDTMGNAISMTGVTPNPLERTAREVISRVPGSIRGHL